MKRWSSAVMVSFAGPLVMGQSLYELPVEPAPARAPGEVSRSTAEAGPAPELLAVSLYAVEPPKPRQFREHDLVTIIISERSKIDRKQEAESEKDYSNDFAVQRFMDIVSLLETRIQATSQQRLPTLALESKSNFEGEASYLREERLTDRVGARVLEVKPNGTLLLEAKRSFDTDEEGSVLILSGMCRGEDITDQNTIQSNQMYDLSLRVENTGDLDRTTRKGLIPRVLESLLNF